MSSARTTPPSDRPRLISHARIGAASTSLMKRSKRAPNTEAALLEYAACAMAIVTRPGTMKTWYSTPSICLMRPPSESPNTRMKRNDEATGARIVWVHSLRTRSTSRPASAVSAVLKPSP